MDCRDEFGLIPTAHRGPEHERSAHRRRPVVRFGDKHGLSFNLRSTVRRFAIHHSWSGDVWSRSHERLPVTALAMYAGGERSLRDAGEAVPNARGPVWEAILRREERNSASPRSL